MEMRFKRDKLMENIPPQAKEVVKKNPIKLMPMFGKENKKIAYDKLQFKRVFMGYDFLQNLAFVRAHIMKKYKIGQIGLLEQILFLTPMNLFTMKDFRQVSCLRYNLKDIRVLIEMGWVEVAQQGHNRAEHIYMPTTKARKLVQELYEMLSGEIPIETKVLEKSEIKSDQIKARIIKELNKKEKPKTVEVLWARKL